MFRSALLALPLLLALSIQAVPTLHDIECKPSKVELGHSVNVTWKLREDNSKPSRGVFTWQIYAQNAVSNASEDAGTPVNGPSSTNLLTDSNISGQLDWYQYGPSALVNYTNQNLCLSTSLPYGKDVDGLGNPEGYSEQTFCPLKCKVAPPSRNYTLFESVHFSPKTVRVGDKLKITWKYQRGFNFPKNVLLSIFFFSDYFEELPQYAINNVAADKGEYTLKVPQDLRDFVTKNERLIGDQFSYRLYMQLTFPPQTNVLGNVAAPGNLTVLDRKPCTDSNCRRRRAHCRDSGRSGKFARVRSDMFESY